MRPAEAATIEATSAVMRPMPSRRTGATQHRCRGRWRGEAFDNGTGFEEESHG
jgi:hypothetical protein